MLNSLIRISRFGLQAARIVLWVAAGDFLVARLL